MNRRLQHRSPEEAEMLAPDGTWGIIVVVLCTLIFGFAAAVMSLPTGAVYAQGGTPVATITTTLTVAPTTAATSAATSTLRPKNLNMASVSFNRLGLIRFSRLRGSES